MRLITRLSLISAALAALGTSASFADDQQLQNRLALRQTQESQHGQRNTTIAVYANDRGVRRSAGRDERSEPRAEVRFNSHGQTYTAYVTE
jgi:hypothetical protein